MSDSRQRLWTLTAASRHAGGSTIERHHHEDHQLVYVSAGVLAVETSAGSWVASKDRAVWLPAGVWHAHRFYGSSMFHAIGFARERPPLPATAPMIVAVTPFLRELLIAAADPELSAAETGRVRAVLRDQLRRSSQQPLSLPTPRDPRLADACALASADPARSIPLAELARQVGASERSLSRLFRDELGMSYPQWRTHLRLLEAMILLSGGASVTRTASQCGWKTTSSFIDTFRHALGQTPGEYRARTR
ncbi:AraC-like DNA-binding protein [Solirubrobacter pauli]|uniref:HTH-type transcriptional regulator RipA n=1 Tax=Solirubrobacter pauli TaxID=166793 RepID=A0A660L9S4_9ACTN|nr:helix-turn-helix transcriptional regulator [Solirubrobacter pauli]RKQ91136.1 AraC-like DNA-binding protein [Solirubrobacter pauli]